MSGYSQEIMEGLIKDNPYFTKSAEERYSIFKHVDPFPNISASLLNSVDVIKYIMTTGMIDSFHIDKLSGATYACEISGEYIYWNEDKVQHKATLNSDSDELKILPNSITFIAVKQLFRIPSYIVLRFNLRVSHVYKGLLLGTGPIVDPCFVGQLFIPLHNLTSNSYIIKKSALIIDVEFTKMSSNPSWSIATKGDQNMIVDNLVFDNIKYEYPDIKAGRSFSEYIDKALSKDHLFYKEQPDKIYINSSLPEEIAAFKKTIASLAEKTNDRLEVMKSIETEMKSTQKFVNVLSIISIASILLAAVAVFCTAGIYFSNSDKLKDAIQTNKTQQETFDIVQRKYDVNTSNLEKRIEDLENRLIMNKIP